ncbi:MAG: hypothetical protein H6942_09635 [Candidatus Accumulibacter sp.]|uniref:hypothetical protein n=1 Tax=Accumulibacter sp. TaxID=2053492 RepID=UPI0019ECB03E|nr:hypothetical protein [Accumulibacter sp.]MBE2260156.1 hypothetical protein [Paracoccaceae bacterium]MCB1943471.1 hypothetical protein [Accumulibacter sp.]MCP5248774.1 hypothetical protein [Accumulibacter sp.]
MSHPDLLIVSIVRALVEVALLCLLGQGAVALLAGAGRTGNPIYRLFQIVTRPAIRLTRQLAPRRVVDRLVPLVAFFLMFGLWILLAWVKRELCGWHGLSGC